MSVSFLLETRFACEHAFVFQIRFQFRYPFTLWIAHFYVDHLVPFDFFSAFNAFRLFSKHPYHLDSTLFISFFTAQSLKSSHKKTAKIHVKEFHCLLPNGMKLSKPTLLARRFWRLAYITFTLIVIFKLRKCFLKVAATCTFEKQLLGKSVIFRRQQLAV